MKTLELSKLESVNASIIGNKAYNLCILLNNNVNVPQGLVIPTDICDEIKLSQKVPKEIIEEITNYLKQNQIHLFSVRSSTVAEDSQDKSWAGLFDSYLNISVKELEESIINCINSSRSPRASFYSQPDKDIDIAVIIQEMVKSKFSGVAFTKNPITGDENEVYIEIVKGSGENIVDGRVTPYAISLLKKTNSKEINEKTSTMKDEYRKIAKKVFEQANIIEQIYHKPVDIEFSHDGKELFILQTRPLTV